MVALTIPRSYQTPNFSADRLLPLLSGDEYKVLHYAMRQTFGFQRETARISLSQFEGGKQSQGGRILDAGTGLSRPTIIRALRTLHAIGAVQQIAPNNARNEGALYRVCVTDDCVDYAWLHERLDREHGAARQKMIKVRAKKGVVNTIYPPAEVVNPIDGGRSIPFTAPVNAIYTQNPVLNPDLNPAIPEESAATPAAIPAASVPEEVDLPQDSAHDQPPSPPTPPSPPGSEPPPAAPAWNVGDPVYYVYTSGVLHTVPAVVTGLTKQKVKIATHEQDRTHAVVWPANLKPRRRDGEPEAWEVEALQAPGKAAPKTQPQTALTKAMFEAIPDDIRPATCHYGKNDTAAQAVMSAGWSAAQVGLFTAWLYAENEWYRRGNDGTPVIISMHTVAQKIRACWAMVERWEARRKPAPAADQPAQPINPFDYSNQKYREKRDRR